MALEPTVKVVLGSTAFAIFWVLAVFPAVPFLPIGRTAGSLLGAMLMVIFRVITPDQAYAAIDLPILGLLFGTMVVSTYLERADMFKYLGKLLTFKSRGGKDLLCRVCLVSAISSALFTNDTTCVVLTEFVLKVARQHNLPPQPFLLALASSANIGSSATPIGNPQNLVIAVQSKISFGKFLAGIVPAMLVGVVLNVVFLLCLFWHVLSTDKDVEEAVPDAVSENVVVSHRFSPATMSHVNSMNSQDLNHLTNDVVQGSPINGDSVHGETLRNRSISFENDIQIAGSSMTESAKISNASKDDKGSSPAKEEDKSLKKSGRSIILSQINGLPDSHSLHASEEKGGPVERWLRFLWKTCVYLVTLGMLIALLMGLNMSWTAITAALALVVLDFKDARPCLEKVSYSLLIFFCGMFITVDGFNRTGIPSAMWDFMEPHSRIDSAGGIAVLALVILVLSNFASNVPTVLLLGARVAASAASISPAEENKAWLILAWVSTVGGNLSLLGSAANLIVCEQARRGQFYRYTLSFWGHLRFGVPSTIIVTSIGLPLIRALLCMIAALRSFSLEKLHYWRESGAGISSLAYFLSKDTIDLFNTLIKPLVYLSMFYFFNNPRSSFTENYIVLLCLVYCVTGVAYAFAILLQPGAAQLWSVLLPVVLTLIATQRNKGSFVKVLASLCYTKWALEAFVISNAARYGGVWLITRCGALMASGYDLHDWGLCLSILIGYGALFRMVAYLCLITFQKK